jgi:hypothetical protein
LIVERRAQGIRNFLKNISKIADFIFLNKLQITIWSSTPVNAWRDVKLIFRVLHNIDEKPKKFLLKIIKKSIDLIILLLLSVYFLYVISGKMFCVFSVWFEIVVFYEQKFWSRERIYGILIKAFKLILYVFGFSIQLKTHKSHSLTFVWKNYWQNTWK